MTLLQRTLWNSENSGFLIIKLGINRVSTQREIRQKRHFCEKMF